MAGYNDFVAGNGGRRVGTESHPNGSVSDPGKSHVVVRDIDVRIARPLRDLHAYDRCSRTIKRIG